MVNVRCAGCQKIPFNVTGLQLPQNNLLQRQNECLVIVLLHVILFSKWGNPGLLFVYFCPFLITFSIIQIEKSIDRVLGIRTYGCMMVDTDNTTKLSRPPITYNS